MTLLHRLGQRIGNTSANPHHGGLLDAELHCHGVGGLEADATDVACQAIGVLRHDLDGVSAIGLEDPYCPRRADAVAVQEDHDFPHRLLLGPGGDDPSRAHWANAADLPQTASLRLDDLEHLVAEGTQQLLGIGRADAPDHTGGKVLLDALDRCGLRGLEKPGPELLAMGTVVDPVPRCGDPLAGRYCRGVTHHGDEVALAPRLDPNDTKAVFGVLVCDALDQPRQYLSIGWLGLRLHGARMRSA